MSKCLGVLLYVQITDLKSQSQNPTIVAQKNREAGKPEHLVIFSLKTGYGVFETMIDLTVKI